MTASRVRRLRWRRVVPVGVAAVVVGAVAASAATSTGYHARQVSQNDASIWTAQGNSTDPANPGSFVGRANTLAGVIDTAVLATARPQLLQDGPHVLIHDAESGSVQSVNTVLGTAGAALTVPPLKAPAGTIAAGAAATADDAGMPAVDLNRAGEVALGSDTAAVVDQAAGRLYVFRADALPSGPLARQPATAKVPAGSQVAVDLGGTVHVVSPDGQVADFTAAGRPLRHGSLGADLGKASTPGSPFSLTTVGSRVVAVDGSGGIYAEGHAGQLGSAGGSSAALLQQPGPARPGVVFQTANALSTMNLASGAVTVLSTAGRGTPSAPAYLAARGCAYAAWAGSPAIPADAGTTGSPAVGPTVAVVCDDGRHYTGAGLPNPQWRANHGSAMLNDDVTGDNLFFDQLIPEKITDWSQAPRQQKTADTQTPSSSTVVAPTTQQQPTGPDHPPVAVSDTLATRPGVPLVARVLANDTDPDGDVLAVTGLTDLPATGGPAVSIVGGGDAVQVTPPAQSLAPVSFGYAIDDGRGLSSSATATVEIHPLSQNGAPVVPGEPAVTVAAGGRVTVDLLRGVTDPDGDPVTVTSVTLPAGDGSAEFTAAGLAVLSPTAAGQVPVRFTVVDGHGGTASGTQPLDVRPAGTAVAPQANDDHLQVTEGVPGTVDVFANDLSGSGNPLSLTAVTPGGAGAGQAGAGQLGITQLGGGVLAVTARAVGTTLVRYTASDGTSQATGTLRVDAVQPTAATVTAVRDDATLRPNQPTAVPVLANDIDRAGNVLLVTGVSGVPPGLSVSQTGHASLTVSTGAPLTGPVTFRYTAGDGIDSDTGTVVVRPAPGGVDQPPVTSPLEVDVRAGNAIPLDVLAHVFDPEGEAVTLVSVTPPEAGQGTLFTEAGQLRYVAPAQPVGAVRGSYLVRDSAGNSATGTVVIHVLPLASTNHPPAPPAVTARVYTGQSVTVVLPLLGIDPDGDVSTLVGVAPSGSLLGTVGAPLGVDRFTFTAGATGGTQLLSYQVRDAGGLLGTGTIAIGVAAPPAEDSPPVALPDRVSLMPGAVRRVSVLANDSDPDGDALHLDPAALTQPGGGSVRIQGGYLEVTAPAAAAENRPFSFAYGVDDGRGGTATSTVTETVTAHPPLAPPGAVDDVAAGQKPGATVRVDVLANDTIVNGTPAQATVTAADGPDVTAAPGGTLSFVMPAHPVTFSYTVTDAAGQSASAVVSVPLAQGLPPVAGPDVATTRAGTAVTLDVLANDRDPQGLPLTLARIGSTAGGTATVTGRTVRFSPAAGFAGLGGFSYVVSDGPASAVGTATVTVTGGTRPPVVSAVSVSLAPGESKTLDLANAVSGVPAGTRISFSGLTGTTGAVRGTLRNATLRLSAPAGAGAGQAALRYTVSDGRPGGTAVGSVQVVVVGAAAGGKGTAASPTGTPQRPGGSATPNPGGTRTAKPSPSPGSAAGRPLPQALADSASTLQDHPVTVDVLANDVDPLGRGLHLVSVSSGGLDGTSAVAGREVSFSPASGYHGVVSLTYVMADASGDPARQSSATVSVTVVGRPDAPGLPSGTARSHQVMLSWTAPSSNGGTISGYTVGYDGGRQSCPGNSCVVTGLTNGRDYTFTVTATDQAGTGPASAASQPIHVDEIPGVPQAPTATPGDQKVSLTWPAPQTDGSPVTSYTVVQSPGGARQAVSSPAATFTGLTNGASYTYQVSATNKAGTSDYSASSAAARPAGPPPTPAAPSATSAQNSGTATVTWAAADGNGSPVTSYTLQVFTDGAVSQTLKESDPSNRSASVAVTSKHSYSFTISATNAAGTSAYSAHSNVVKASGVPAQVSSIQATNAGDGTHISLAWGAPDDAGQPITGYTVTDSAGGTMQFSTPGGSYAKSGSEGQKLSFTVTACNADGCGPASPASNAVTLSGPPGSPGIKADVSYRKGAKNYSITYTWSLGNDGGSPVTGWKYDAHGGAPGTSTSGNARPSQTSFTDTQACGQLYSAYITVTAMNANGTGNPNDDEGSGDSTRPC